MLLAAPLVRVAPELAPIGIRCRVPRRALPGSGYVRRPPQDPPLPVYYSAFAALRSLRGPGGTVGGDRRRRPVRFSARPSTASPTCTAADWSCGRGRGTPTAPCTTTTAGPGSPRDSSCGTTAQSRTSRCRSGCRFLLYLLNGLFQQVVLRHARRRRRVHDDPAPSRSLRPGSPLRSGRPVAVPPGPVPRRRSEAVATTTTRRSRIVNVPHNHLADRQRRRSRINRSSLAHTMSVVRLH